jgi:hypothetical protein
MPEENRSLTPADIKAGMRVLVKHVGRFGNVIALCPNNEVLVQLDAKDLRDGIVRRPPPPGRFHISQLQLAAS